MEVAISRVDTHVVGVGPGLGLVIPVYDGGSIRSGPSKLPGKGTGAGLPVAKHVVLMQGDFTQQRALRAGDGSAGLSWT